MKIVAIIQARMSSSRLPGKVLMTLFDRPVIQWVYERAARIPGVDAVVVATTTSQADDALASLCERHGWPVFRGSEDDVLDRYVSCAQAHDADAVVRVTADCPLLDPVQSGRVVELFVRAQPCDYVSNCEPPTFPDGLDTEVISRAALELSWRTATQPHDREHVTAYVRAHLGRFTSRVVICDPSLSQHRWTLDEPRDFAFLSAVVERLQRENLTGTLEEILEILEAEPQLCDLNSGIIRNAGATRMPRQTEGTVTPGTGPRLYERAKRLMPGGTQLLSKRPERFLPDQWPAYYRRAKGASVWDLDGARYLDMTINAVGSCPLGFADDDVNAAVIDAVSDGSMATLNCPEEVELAELLCQLHPWAEMCRFARTGAEAMAIAVRIARARTRRSVVAVCGYHGWSDWYLAANHAEPDALGEEGLLLSGLDPGGVPRELAGTTLTFRHNDVDGLQEIAREHSDRLAAIVCEPQRDERPAPGFLQALREIADQTGAVLIFDEISAALRLTTGGVHLLYDVAPDLAVLAKAISNGFPMAAVIGTADVMDAAQTSFISSTYWTERVGPTAALATLRKFARINGPQLLIEAGRAVQATWTRAAQEVGLDVSVGHPDMPPLSHLDFGGPDPQAVRTLYCQLMLARGYLDNGSYYATTAHTPEILREYDETVRDAFGALARIVDADRVRDELRGPVAQFGFARLTDRPALRR